jgi:adenosylcobinamide-phosphate guanylyltransferase
MIIAILMAGGKGERMNSKVEKPLFSFMGKPLIEHVLENLKESQYIEKIVVAVSTHTPETEKYLRKKSFNRLNDSIDHNDNESNKNINPNSNNNYHGFFNYIKTPGNGYLNDLSFLLSYFEIKSKENILLFINTDLPFVFPKMIDYILEKYLNNNTDAMSVLVPLSIFESYGITPSYIFDDLVPSGLNILISQNKVQNEEKLIISRIELALNINTIDDVNVANCLFENNQIHDS